MQLPGKWEPTLGIGLQYEMPSSSKSTALRLEMLSESQRYECDVTNQNNNTDYTYEQQFRVATRYLRVPVLARYTYPRGRFRPFVEGGLALNFALSVSQEQRNRNTGFGPGTYSNWGSITATKPLSYEQSVVGGFGLTLGQPAARNLSVQVRGEYGPGFVESDATADIHINRTYLLLTYDLTK